MQTRIHGSQGGLSDARIAQDSVIVLPIPNGRAGSVSFLGGSNLAIPAINTKEEAVQLLLFLTADSSLDAYTKQIGFLPASKKVLESWAEDEAYKNLVALLETGRTYPALPEWGTIEQTLVSMFSAVWDLLEIPALYSEEKLYRIFKEKSDIIDSQLGYTPTHTMTFAEFQEIWQRSIVKSDTTEQAPDQAKEPEGISINPTLYVFFVVLVISFIFSYTRKRKKR